MKPSVVILAAGRGKRMKSNIPKVMHRIFDKPMLRYALDAVRGLKPSRIIIVSGGHDREIKAALNDKDILYAIQKEPKGTGNAVSMAKAFLKDFKGTVLVLNGDSPLITTKTLKKFLGLHRKRKNDISLISFQAANPAAYGRVLRDETGSIESIVEEKDATEEQKRIKEVNSGVYAMESGVLELLRKIPLNRLKGEYYLTDIIGIARDRGHRVEAFCIGTEDEMMGVNTMPELLKAQKGLRKKIIDRWIVKGVRFMDPDSVFISPEVIIGRETTIYPNVYLEGKTRLGSGCTVYPNVRLIDSMIEDGAVIKDSTLIECSVVRKKAMVGPFAHVRPGSDIGSEAKIGNFVEVKKSVIGKRTKASHLSYLGDASIGSDVNIGAGTITCNYDGKQKYKTIIEDNVFIGSDAQLVAPVSIGRGAYVGAGSTITKNVPSHALAVSRVRQENIEGWAIKRQSSVVSRQSSVRNKKSEVRKRKGR